MSPAQSPKLHGLSLSSVLCGESRDSRVAAAWNAAITTRSTFGRQITTAIQPCWSADVQRQLSGGGYQFDLFSFPEQFHHIDPPRSLSVCRRVAGSGSSRQPDDGSYRDRHGEDRSLVIAEGRV